MGFYWCLLVALFGHDQAIFIHVIIYVPAGIEGDETVCFNKDRHARRAYYLGRNLPNLLNSLVTYCLHFFSTRTNNLVEGK